MNGAMIALLLSVLGGSCQLGAALVGDSYREGTVYYDGASGTYSYYLGIMDKHGVAYGYYNNSLNATGWGTLEVKSECKQSPCNNSVVMYAAGFLEGVLTSQQIWQQYLNVKPYFIEEGQEKSEEAYRKFFAEQDIWMRDMIQKNEQTDDYWRHVSYVVSQYDGLYAGYKETAQSGWETNVFVVQMLNGVGDMLDIKRVVDPSSTPDFSKFTREEMRRYLAVNGHCSALIKVTGGYENLFMSHNSWFTYSATTRIYKHYHLNVNDSATVSHSMSFSSYPGFIESLDDFYVMDSKLVLLQTTNNINNQSLVDLIKPQALFAWHRVRVSNMMASSGQKWYTTFKMYNSGTYNNQYMVIDLKKVTLNQSLRDHTLWVIEQIPGLVVGQDETEILRTGHFPSYNVPFFEIIYNVSGYTEIVAQHGPGFSYELDPRAKIFRRDAGKVVDMDSMKDLMRYNDYVHDLYSDGNPWNAICSRGDLHSEAPSADGCYDAKVTDFNMALDMTSFAISGPTTSHNLEPFSWTGQFANKSHIGLPETYNFGWTTMKPKIK